jgi:hypothetical protein
MYQVELKDGRILSMNARDVQMFRPLIRAFLLAPLAPITRTVLSTHARLLRRPARSTAR